MPQEAGMRVDEMAYMLVAMWAVRRDPRTESWSAHPKVATRADARDYL